MDGRGREKKEAHYGLKLCILTCNAYKKNLSESASTQMHLHFFVCKIFCTENLKYAHKYTYAKLKLKVVANNKTDA